MNKLNNIVEDKKGSIAIEASVLFPTLLLIFFVVLEMGRILFLGSALNIITTDITRRASLTEEVVKESKSYASIFYNQLSKELTLWSVLASKDNLIVDVKFCNSIQQVIDDNCENSVESDSQIILYNVKYQYNHLFNSLFNTLAESSLNQKTIVYREFHS